MKRLTRLQREVLRAILDRLHRTGERTFREEDIPLPVVRTRPDIYRRRALAFLCRRGVLERIDPTPT